MVLSVRNITFGCCLVNRRKPGVRAFSACCAITIKKSQGQTLYRVELNLRNDILRQGQLYVTFTLYLRAQLYLASFGLVTSFTESLTPNTPRLLSTGIFHPALNPRTILLLLAFYYLDKGTTNNTGKIATKLVKVYISMHDSKASPRIPGTPMPSIAPDSLQCSRP